MSDMQPEEPAEATGRAADEPDRGEAESVAPTGHPAVDEVLRSLDRLESLPVDEHPAVYEQAHDSLRQSLTDAQDGGARRETDTGGEG